MRRHFLVAPLLLGLSGVVAAQPAPAPVLPPLPVPDQPPGDRPSDYLRAAQNALAAGRAGEAQSALEMAQTRILDRSVPLGQTGNPSDNPTIVEITQARAALAAHDRANCQRLIQEAITSATAQGF